MPSRPRSEVVDGQIERGMMNGSIDNILNRSGVLLQHKDFIGAENSQGWVSSVR